MKLQPIVAIIVSFSLFPIGSFAEDQPEGQRVTQVRGGRNVMVEPGGQVDAPPDDDRLNGGQSHDGSDDPALLRETVDFKSWLAASKLWNSLRPAQKNVALSRTLRQVAFGTVLLGGTYYLLSRSPLAVRMLAAVGVVTSLFVGSANADETLQFQVEREGVDRFYFSYNLSVNAMEQHRNNKAAMIDFHRKLYDQMIAEAQNSGLSR